LSLLQVRKGFGLDHETITKLAEQEEAGSAGVNFLPFLTGERTPNWPHSYGVLTGMRPGSMRPGLLYRAALEGATFSLLNGDCPSMTSFQHWWPLSSYTRGQACI
jgi:xylulokinase